VEPKKGNDTTNYGGRGGKVEKNCRRELNDREHDPTM